MKKSYKDTDLREALRRKYSDSPQLPADFMEKMQERLTQQDETSSPKPATQKRLWRWVAAAACLLILIGVGITMLPKDQAEQAKDLYAQTKSTQIEEKKSTQEEQLVDKAQTNNIQEHTPNPAENTASPATSKSIKSIVAEVSLSTETASPVDTVTPVEITPPMVIPATNYTTTNTNLHYASQSLTEDSIYLEPSKMDEFIAKIADFNKVKAVPLDCISENGDNAVVNTAYVFPDTKELNLFGRLLQAACSYDSKTPGYLLNFSHQQFFFTLKDLRKGEKYLWIAERINGSRILLYTTHSPVEANVSTACYQNYREQLTHTYLSSLQY